jgi:Kef-type K+ transport system membrane component KefB
VVELLGTFGIVSIFLYAGLETDLHELHLRAKHLLQHCAVRLALIAAVSLTAIGALEFGPQAGVVLALALLTPSGGFILESLPLLGVDKEESATIRTRVIALEILSLAVLLFALKSDSPVRFGVAIGSLTAMALVVPFLMKGIVRFVVPYAPKSEFAFLVVIAAGCAIATRELGVYYLVGAFVVGITARRFRDKVPAMSSDQMLHVVESFTSLFAPFYFFRAGTELRVEDFTWNSLALGLVLLVVACALRIGSMVELAWWSGRERAGSALRKAVPLMPTLVFTLVMTDILRERFELGSPWTGALVFYAVFTTILPGIVFRRLPAPQYGGPSLPPWPADHG